MSVLTVRTYPDLILKQQCADVTEFDVKLHVLISDMFETMKDYEGVGLAAPQIGVSKNLVVIKFKNRKITLINPVIVEKSGSVVDEEGCLSCPHKLVLVERAEKVKVQAFNKKGKPITLEEEGFVARIIQHEIDHLFGVLIIEKGQIIENHREL